MAAQERCRQGIQTQEQPSFPTYAAGPAISGSSLQLAGRVPPIPEGQDGAAEQEMHRTSVGRPTDAP